MFSEWTPRAAAWAVTALAMQGRSRFEPLLVVILLGKSFELLEEYQAAV